MTRHHLRTAHFVEHKTGDSQKSVKKLEKNVNARLPLCPHTSPVYTFFLRRCVWDPRNVAMYRDVNYRQAWDGYGLAERGRSFSVGRQYSRKVWRQGAQASLVPSECCKWSSAIPKGEKMRGRPRRRCHYRRSVPTTPPFVSGSEFFLWFPSCGAAIHRQWRWLRHIIIAGSVYAGDGSKNRRK